MKWPRFKRRRNAYYAGPIDAPSVVLMVAGFALWLVWPSRKDVVASPRVAGNFRVSYAGDVLGQARQYRGPTTFFDRRRAAVELPSEGFAQMIGMARKRRMRLLQRDRSSGEDDVSRRREAQTAATSDFPASPVMAARSLRGYTPQWERDAVFLRRETQDPRLVVRFTEGLRDAGFEPPELGGLDLVNGKAWEVALFVEWQDDGRARHVFLERGSGDAAVNAAVVRAMYRVELPDASGAVSGRVTLSFGRQ